MLSNFEFKITLNCNSNFWRAKNESKVFEMLGRGKDLARTNLKLRGVGMQMEKVHPTPFFKHQDSFEFKFQ